MNTRIIILNVCVLRWKPHKYREQKIIETNLAKNRSFWKYLTKSLCHDKSVSMRKRCSFSKDFPDIFRMYYQADYRTWWN